MRVALSVDADLGLHLHPEDKAGSGWTPIAWATYENTVQKNGWGYLSVRASDDPKVSDDLKVYAAGFLEGFASAKQVRAFQHYLAKAHIWFVFRTATSMSQARFTSARYLDT